MLRRSLIAALALSAVVLTGCTDAPRIPPADPTPTDAPLFASDEEALAAATEVYEEYLVGATTAAQSGGQNVELLQSVTTPEYFAREVDQFREFRENGWVSEGQPELQSIELQQRFDDQVDGTVLLAYACLDVSSVRIINSDGLDVTSPDRPPVATLEVEFVTELNSREFLLSRSESWQGESNCL